MCCMSSPTSPDVRMERRGTGSRHAPDAAAFFTPFRFRASMWVDWAHGFAPLAVYSPSCVETRADR